MSDSPALIIVENWRAKIVMSLGLTPVPNLIAAECREAALLVELQDDVAHLGELGLDGVLALAVELALDDLAGLVANRVGERSHL